MSGSTRFGLIAVAAALAGTAGVYCMGTRASGQVAPGITKKANMKREIIRVEPLSTYLEKWKAPTSAVARCGDMIYVTGAPPFVPETGEIFQGPIERQTELVLEQMKKCVEAAGSDFDHVLKCNVYCTSVEAFAAVNEVYVRFFPKDPPARIFINVPKWAGPFDIEIDCIAVRKDN
jgi:2-iminobutanoate/2-iminopropanoate deaminase